MDNKKKRKDNMKGGKADDRKPSDFCPDQLAKGIKIEMEHTDDPELAKEIAMDHLEESKDFARKDKPGRGLGIGRSLGLGKKRGRGGKYYDRLEEMEKDIENKTSSEYFNLTKIANTSKEYFNIKKIAGVDAPRLDQEISRLKKELTKTAPGSLEEKQTMRQISTISKIRVQMMEEQIVDQTNTQNLPPYSSDQI